MQTRPNKARLLDWPGIWVYLQLAVDRDHEAAGGLYHVGTVRVECGVDVDLPTREGIGCRVRRLPLGATWLVEPDDEYENYDDAANFRPHWLVRYGNAYTGCMSPTRDFESKTADEACEWRRARLFAHGDCFRTRAEARAAVVGMLAVRAVAAKQRAERAHWRRWFTQSVVNPLVGDILRDAQRQGLVPQVPVQIRWTFPEFPFVNPLKDG